MTSVKRCFFYVKCRGDNTWLAKPANQGNFTKDIRKAAPLTEAEAKANGFGNAMYPLVPVAVAFDPQRRTKGRTNGYRADTGRAVLALAYLLMRQESGYKALHQWAATVDLTQEPEIPLIELLANLMHYCQREGIAFYGDDGALPAAKRRYATESGGAAL